MSDFEISIDLSQIEREMEAIKEEKRRAMKEAVAETVWWVYTLSKNWLTKLIYQREIPILRPKGVRGKMGQKARQAAGGKPEWRRTYDLRNAERVSVNTDGTGGKVFTDPSSRAGTPIKNWPGGYAQLQHDREKKPANWRTRASEEGQGGAANKIRELLSK